MKATDKSHFYNIEVERMKIPDEYKTEPVGFKGYKWVSQDNTIVPIKEFNDSHLFFTYRMLINTILYAREKTKHKMLTSQMRRIVTLCNYHLHYIAHELYLRNYPESKDESNKYKIDPKELEKL